jgi:hypothetical protein
MMTKQSWNGPIIRCRTLVKEQRLAGISTMEAPNAFLPAFVQTYNARFAKPPANERDLHRPIAGTNDEHR